jgi:uncharacterized protein YgbK (DUF1537 family)
MRQIAIIADDLTGASDSGVQFARKGLRTGVLFAVHNMAADTQSLDAVAVDTDSRAAPAAEARERARQAALRAAEAGFAHIYKKVDSTLRGNLGPEIDGVMDAIPFDVAVIAPAFPRLGRTTIGGGHFLNGKPVNETEIARDPKCPVREAHIPTLLAGQSRRKSGLVELEALRSGMAPEAVAALKAAGTDLIVFDAEAEADLERIAAEMAGSPYRILWVGSAGLADCLPGPLHLTAGAAQPPSVTAGGHPVLLVAGSISRITRVQAEAYCRKPGVAAVELNPLLVLQDDEACRTEAERCRAALGEAIAAGRDAALIAGSAPDQVTGARERGAALGLDATAVSNRIATVLGDVAAGITQRHALAGLILTGGDTAKAVCRRLGVTGLALVRELEAGVPLSLLVGGPGLPVVTKAGAFGDDETLVRALHALKGDA